MLFVFRPLKTIQVCMGNAQETTRIRRRDQQQWWWVQGCFRYINLINMILHLNLLDSRGKGLGVEKEGGGLDGDSKSWQGVYDPLLGVPKHRHKYGWKTPSAEAAQWDFSGEADGPAAGDHDKPICPFTYLRPFFLWPWRDFIDHYAENISNDSHITKASKLWNCEKVCDTRERIRRLGATSSLP